MKLNDTTINALVQQALEARQRAYAPYSNYPVGAALLCENGEVFIGCNVENASTPAGICAERTAIVKAVSEGQRTFVAIAVATRDGGSPCGICRQVINEFAPNAMIIIANGNGEVTDIVPLTDLLPRAFGPSNLQIHTDEH